MPVPRCRAEAGCFAVAKTARHRDLRAGSALQSAGRAGCETHVQRSCVQSVLGGEDLETRPLFSCGPLCRIEPLRLGQAGPHQVHGPAQLRVGSRREAIGPCEAPVELVHGRANAGITQKAPSTPSWYEQ